MTVDFSWRKNRGGQKEVVQYLSSAKKNFVDSEHTVKQTVVHVYDGLGLGNKKELAIDTYNDLHESPENYMNEKRQS